MGEGNAGPTTATIAEVARDPDCVPRGPLSPLRGTAGGCRAACAPSGLSVHGTVIPVRIGSIGQVRSDRASTKVGGVLVGGWGSVRRRLSVWR